MARPDIRRPGAVDAAWLTGVLQAGGVDAVVKGFSAASVGTGQIGDSVRFKLTYERAGADGPAQARPGVVRGDPAGSVASDRSSGRTQLHDRGLRGI